MGDLSHLKEQAEGRQSRQRTRDAVLDLLTSDAIPSDQLREASLALVYFEPKILVEIDRIGRSYDSPKERDLRVALLLGIALRAIGLLA